MTRHWTLQDIIDLEYFFQQDSEASSSALHSRDRHIYLKHAESGSEEIPPDSSSLLSIWLTAQRETHDGELQGTMVHEAHVLLRLILSLLGICTGVSSGLVFFSYSGTTPVNVLHFLVLFVFSQLVLATILLSRAGLLQLGLRSLPRTLAIRIMAALSIRVITALQRQGNKQLTASQRLAMQAAYGKLKMTNSSYSSLFYWLLFQLIQLAAIFFNIGLLAATFFKVMVSDVAFGWQSTIQFSSQSLHTFVSWLALPWSWFFPEGIAYPTLAEIEGSRIILKEGIANLLTPDLISWWPFLLLSVVVYGLLLRLSFYGYGWFRQRQAGAKLQFDTPAARQIIRRMQTPLVSTQAQPESELQADPLEPRHTQETEQPDQSIPANPVFLLLPDEIFDMCNQDHLGHILAVEGFQLKSSRRFMVDYESDQHVLQDLGKYDWSDSAGIIILMEAWMPPLVSFLSFIKEIRQKVGTNLPIMLRLVGKPSDETLLTPVRDTTQSRVWQQKMASLGDPYLDIADLINKESA